MWKALIDISSAPRVLKNPKDNRRSWFELQMRTKRRSRTEKTARRRCSHPDTTSSRQRRRRKRSCWRRPSIVVSAQLVAAKDQTPRPLPAHSSATKNRPTPIPKASPFAECHEGPVYLYVKTGFME